MKKLSPIYQLFILGVTFLSLSVISVDILVAPKGQFKDLINFIDSVVCFVFIGDFFKKFLEADSKKQYLKWGWIDIISSIPIIDVLRYGRILRVVRILRVIKSIKHITHYIYDNKRESVVFLMGFTTFLLILISGVLMYDIESKIDGSNITTMKDAIWWAFVTITTVGYGDFYPVTSVGRFLASILMIYGVGVFSMLTGVVSSVFMNQRDASNDEVILDLTNKINELASAIKKENENE